MTSRHGFLLAKAAGQNPAALVFVMPTIGYKWNGPKGDYTAICGYCGVAWHRSDMTKDKAGNLVCPDEGSGRDAVTLAKLEAKNRLRLRRRQPIDGRMDTSGPSAAGLPSRALDWDDLTYENSATRYGAFGATVHGSFAADVPAVFTSGQKRYLLISGGLTNLNTYSAQLDQWSLTGAGVVANYAEDPNGGATADLMRVSGSGNGATFLATLDDVTDYTISVFYKREDGDEAFLALFADQAEQVFTSVLRGRDVWQRWSSTVNSSSGVGAEGVVYGSLLTGSTNGLLLWGAQMQSGTWASSYYVPTGASSVTQPADKASMATTSGLRSGWWTIDVVPDFSSANVDGSGNTYYLLYVDTDQYLAFVQDTLVWATPGGTITMSDIGTWSQRRAMTIQCNFIDGYMSVEGPSLPQRQSGTVSDWTGGTVFVGMDSAYANHFEGWISEPRLSTTHRTTAADL